MGGNAEREGARLRPGSRVARRRVRAGDAQLRPYFVGCSAALSRCNAYVRIKGDGTLLIERASQTLSSAQGDVRAAAVFPRFVRVPESSTDYCAASGRAFSYRDGTQNLARFTVEDDMEATVIMEFAWGRKEVPTVLQVQANGQPPLRFRIRSVSDGQVFPYFEGMSSIPCF